MDKRSKLLFLFSASYLLIFTFLAIFEKNYEFLFYILILVLVILVLILYHKKLYLTYPLLVGLTLVGFLHLIGGFVFVKGIRLYDISFLPFFKYDNLIHLSASFSITCLAYNMLNPHLDPQVKHDRFLFSLLLLALACGFGALNEVLELGAVVFFHASAQVGGYFNNALDLVFNLIGALLACLWIYSHKKTL